MLGDTYSPKSTSYTDQICTSACVVRLQSRGLPKCCGPEDDAVGANRCREVFHDRQVVGDPAICRSDIRP